MHVIFHFHNIQPREKTDKLIGGGENLLEPSTDRYMLRLRDLRNRKHGHKDMVTRVEVSWDNEKS